MTKKVEIELSDKSAHELAIIADMAGVSQSDMLNKYLNLKGSVRPKFTPEKQTAISSFLETLEWDMNRLIAKIEKQPNATVEILESFRKEFAFGVKGIEAVRADMNN